MKEKEIERKKHREEIENERARLYKELSEKGKLDDSRTYDDYDIKELRKTDQE